jgi:hypothetical protein
MALLNFLAKKNVGEKKAEIGNDLHTILVSKISEKMRRNQIVANRTLKISSVQISRPSSLRFQINQPSRRWHCKS